MMNNNSDSEIIKLILDSEILSEHRVADSELDNLLAIVSQSPTVWKNQNEIHISPPSSQPNSTHEEVFKRRLKFAPNTPETQQIRTALTLLVNYLSSYPNEHYQDVTFNCPHKSYSIFCGLTSAGMNVICVMVGNHIPEYAFKKSAE